MLLILYLAQYEHEEYERRVHAHLLERALLKARKEQTNPTTQLVSQYIRLIVGSL